MLILRQSTARDIRMGPYVSVSDGFTPVTTATIASADEAEVLKHDGAATVAMAGTLAAVTGADGWYDYTASTGDTDTVGEVVFLMNDDSLYLPVWRTAYVVEEAIYDLFFAASADGNTALADTIASDIVQIYSDTTIIASDVAQVYSDTTVIASDVVVITSDTTAIESELIVVHSETTVIASDTAVIETDTSTEIPDLIGGIGAGSSSGFNFPVSADNTGGAIIDGVTFVGTQTGTFANTEANTATFHQIDDATNAFDLVYRIAAGATNLFTSVSIDAYMTSSNDTASIQLYDHVGADWETVATITGTNGTAQTEYSISPFAKHTGVLGGAEAGNIYVRFVTTGQSNPTLFISRVVGTAVAATSTMGYENGTVWVDETGGTSTGTTQGVDGIFANQCDDFDNGQTIADNLGTSFIHIHPGNSITLSAALQGYNISNVQATLNGGSQNTDSTRVTGGFIAGTWARAGTGITTFVGCSMTSVTADRCALLQGCGIVGTFTLAEAGLYPIVDAQAGGPTGIATIDFASLGGATVNMEGWKGNLTIANMATGDTLNLHAAAGGDVVLGGANGTVNISGVIGSVTDNRTGSPTLNDLSTAARFTTVDSDLTIIASDTAAIEAAGGALSTAQDSKLTQVHSDTIIIGSDVVLVYSDTTAIEAAGGSLTTAQDSKLTKVTSDVVIVSSDLLQVYSDTTIIASDLVVVGSDAAAIHSQTTRIESDLDVANFTTAVQTSSDIVSYMDANSTTISDIESSLVIIKSDLVITTSDTTAIESELILVHSETTAIQAAGGSLTTAQDSKLTKVTSDVVIVASDVVQIYSDTTVIASDTAVIEAAGGGLTTAQDSRLTRVQSDVVIVQSDLLQVYSDTTIIASDAVVITTDIASLSTKQDSDMVVVAAATDAIDSQLTVTDAVVDNIYSDTTVIASDVVVMTSDTTAIQAKTDQMTFSKANELDANTKSINDAEVVGDGNATPWDGA